MDNHARRSFARADINTVITLVSAPRKVSEGHTVRFVAFKQPFEDVVFSENLLEIENATGTLRDNRFRVFPITVGELLLEGSEVGRESSRPHGEMNFAQQQYVGDKWGGKYLRAPDIFFTILEKGKGKLVRLGEIAEVRRGFTTGANDFFYLEPLGPGSRPGLLRVRNGAGWEGEIEEEFLKPVIKSPRECRTIVIKPEDLKYRIFMCHKSKEELEGTKALEYIEWGERQEYYRRSTLRSRRRWWDLGSSHNNTIAWAMIHAERHNVHYNPYGVELDHNFFEILSNIKLLSDSLAAVCISTLLIMVKELFGRQYGGGSGPIKNEGIDLAGFICINPSIFTSSQRKRLIYALKEIANREVKSVFEELGWTKPTSYHNNVPQTQMLLEKPLPDRKALDDIVFDALGLSEEERKEVYRAVCQLVWERISKARSVNRGKK